MRVKLGSVTFLKAAGSGYGIGLSADGHRVEFLGDWRTLSGFVEALDNQEIVHVEVETWQVIALDGELRLPLTDTALTERHAFLQSALGHSPGE